MKNNVTHRAYWVTGYIFYVDSDKMYQFIGKDFFKPLFILIVDDYQFYEMFYVGYHIHVSYGKLFLYSFHL